MKLNVTQKILAGYVVGFILLMAFAALTLFNGKKIEATTIALSQEKIPGLIAVASLKSSVQAQSNQLYELYATNDIAVFNQQKQLTITNMQQQISKLAALAEYKQHQTSLAQLGVKQSTLSNNFVQIMRAPEVDWDAARTALAAFSNSANETSAELDNLVASVSTNTLNSAKVSQKLTEQLINLALILAGLIFLGVIAMAYYSHRQVAAPLREISDVLSGIVARKDLTYRIQYRSEDEIGQIATNTNNLLEEFQRLARILDGTAQEVNRATNGLAEITDLTVLKTASTRLQKLAENMQTQIKLLNF